MSLRETARPRGREAPEGVQVASLLNAAKLLRAIGKTDTLDEIAEAERRGDDIYGEFGAFRDPVGELAIDTGPTFNGAALPRFLTPQGLKERGPTLREYLDGNENAGILPDVLPLDDYRVGLVDEPGRGFAAGVSPPSVADLPDGTRRVLDPGMLFVRSDKPEDEIPGLFDHEFTHVLQSSIGDNIGSTIDLADTQTQHAATLGKAPEDISQRLKQGRPPKEWGKVPYLRYLHSMGESAARGTQIRTMDPPRRRRAPSMEDYGWNDDGLAIDQDLLWQYTLEDEGKRRDWWRSKWK